MTARPAGAAAAPAAAAADTAGQHEHDRGNKDTRSRLRDVALQLFAEQGYEKTSLREIAERLGVTKAALYYYFKSKEDIVASLIQDYVAQLDELIAWGRGQPAGADTRSQIVRRYLRITLAGTEVFRLLHQNQAALAGLSQAKDRGALFRERMDALVELLAGPDAPLRRQVRAASCLMSLSFCGMRYQDSGFGAAELEAELLDLARELVAGEPAGLPA